MLYCGINVNLKIQVNTILKKPLYYGGKIEAYNKTFNVLNQKLICFWFIVKENDPFLKYTWRKFPKLYEMVV